MKLRFLSGVLACALFAVAFLFSESVTLAQRRARQTRNVICFDPTRPCKSAAEFQPYDLPFRIPQNAVIWDSEPFYAVILKSMRVKDDDYEHFIPEEERLAAQALFPDRKVFADRYPEAGSLSYTGIRFNTRIMAVYAGQTRAEAERMLMRVKATGKFPGANIRRMRAAFNGT